jgi:hypothetical protein
MIVFAFALIACAPQGFVALPDEQIATIGGLFIALFALGFDWAIGRAPWLEILRKYQTEWALLASAAFVTWLQNILPTGFEDVSIKGVGFVLALLAAVIPYLVIRKALARRGVRGFTV